MGQGRSKLVDLVSLSKVQPVLSQVCDCRPPSVKTQSHFQYFIHNSYFQIPMSHVRAKSLLICVHVDYRYHPDCEDSVCGS